MYHNSNINGDGLSAELRLLSAELKGWRFDFGLTLKQLSEITGISVGFLSDIENGRSMPSLNTLQKLANAYQKTVTIDIGFYS